MQYSTSLAEHATEIEQLSVDAVFPSPENDDLYHPVDRNDPSFKSLVASIGDRGILEPIIVTQDNFIVSGHRRHAAAQAAGLDTIPCRRIDVWREDDGDEFVRLLREHNLQRVKTFDERVREELVSVNSDDAYAHLKEYRERKSGKTDFPESIILKDIAVRTRKRITDAKSPMIEAIQKVLDDNREYWPLSVRQVHYRLGQLPEPPLKHASKPDSKYRLDKPSYDAAVELIARAREAEIISWDAIGDSTRPVTIWEKCREPGEFIAEQTEELFCGYQRDLMQSQPAHIEVFAEKLTLKKIVESVTADYTITSTIGRGFCSIGPRREIAERFKASGRDRLVVLLISDHDPDGMGIADNFASYFRDKMKINSARIHAIRVAVTPEQIERLNLPNGGKAKKTSSRYAEFVKRFGDQIWEVEEAFA